MSTETDKRRAELLREASRLMRETPDLGECPAVPHALAAYLVRLYPPRCHDPRIETLEEHLDYAGMSRLAASLLALAKEQTEDGDDGDKYPDEAPIDEDYFSEMDRAGGAN